MNLPLVSIIIPTYNRTHLIGKTLDSILAQSYDNWECIVVDDGSTDDTELLLKKYCENDPRFHYHKRPIDRPKGANACRNYGFELSLGEYINWFDSDDEMLPSKLEKQIHQLHNSSYDFSICQTEVYNVEKESSEGLRTPKLISDSIFEDYIIFNIFWLTGAPLWKRSFLIDNNLRFDEELQQAQDYDFHMRILAISENYCTIDEPLVIFNIHEFNMSHSTSDNPLKIFSNAKVNKNILWKYRNKLSLNVLNFRYKELLKLYKFSVRKRQFKNAFYILKFLILNINILSITILTKFLLILKLIVSFFSFLIFSKGDSFLNIKIK
jgi:glycosyltransferase involved in cell wall biosynthesis